MKVLRFVFAALLPVAAVLGCNQPSNLSGPASTIPLASGGGGGAFIYCNGYSAAGSTYWGGLFSGTVTFDSQGRLTSYYDGSGFNFASTAVAEFGADGTVAWGRWSSGTISGSTNDTGASPILHYAVGETTVDPSTLASLVKTYTAFASDAPTIDNGSSLTAGLPNGTTGTLSVNCVSNTLTYSLTITVGGQQFVVSGSGSIPSSSSNLFGSSGATITDNGSTVTSPGQRCAVCNIL